jgi:hypothetical protein
MLVYVNKYEIDVICSICREKCMQDFDGQSSLEKINWET